MNELRSTSSDVIEMLIQALELSSHPVTVSYVEALREVLRLRAIVATGRKWNDELTAALASSRQCESVCHCGELMSKHSGYDGHSAVPMEEPCPFAEEAMRFRTENARLNQLLSGRDENQLSRETHE